MSLPVQMRRLGITLWLVAASTAKAFVIVQPPWSTAVNLAAKKRRGSGLRDVDTVESRPTKRPPKRAVKPNSSSGTISPALAQWAAQSGSDSSSTSAAEPETTITSTPSAETFAPFEQTTPSHRRVRQSARQALEEERAIEVQALVDELETVLAQDAKSLSLDGILAPIRALTALPSCNFRQLTASGSLTARNHFRLAWVGSDDAVCHLCTGLHKVPLARLQEVFLSLSKNQVTVEEVIRILGPFPNVKNTLSGRSKVLSMDPIDWRITWESMIDGTGKELLAGKEENERQVDLRVVFCDPLVIVAVVPGNAQDVMGEQGEKTLVFVRETEMEEKLEALRVA